MQHIVGAILGLIWNADQGFDLERNQSQTFINSLAGRYGGPCEKADRRTIFSDELVFKALQLELDCDADSDADSECQKVRQRVERANILGIDLMLLPSGISNSGRSARPSTSLTL